MAEEEEAIIDHQRKEDLRLQLLPSLTILLLKHPKTQDRPKVEDSEVQREAVVEANEVASQEQQTLLT